MLNRGQMGFERFFMYCAGKYMEKRVWIAVSDYLRVFCVVYVWVLQGVISPVHAFERNMLILSYVQVFEVLSPPSPWEYARCWSGQFFAPFWAILAKSAKIAK